MSREDTMQLLNECNAGIKMSLESMMDVLTTVQDKQLKQRIYTGIDTHRALEQETLRLMQRFGETPKAPSPLMRGMVWMKNGVQLTLNRSGASAASLLTDECNNGIKMISRYKNRCVGADPDARLLADKVIRTEQGLADELRSFL